MNKWMLIAIAAVGLIACHRNPPAPVVPHPKEMETGYIESYGAYYDSIAQNVFSLDFYSKGLDLDSTLRMYGTGFNLYFSDIFSDGEELAEGVYTSDTTGAAGTFLSGRLYDGMPNGSYLLYVEDRQVVSIDVYEKGELSIQRDGDIWDIHCAFFGNRKDTVYQAHYKGVLTPIKRK